MRPFGAVSVSTGLLAVRSSSTRLHRRGDGRPLRLTREVPGVVHAAGVVLLAVLATGAVGVAPVAEPASAGLRLPADLVEHEAPYGRARAAARDRDGRHDGQNGKAVEHLQRALTRYAAGGLLAGRSFAPAAVR